MNSSNHFMTIFPSSSYEFNLTHSQCQDDGVSTIPLSAASEANHFKSNHSNTIHSMMMIDDAHNDDTNQGDDDYHYPSYEGMPSGRNVHSASGHYNDRFLKYAQPFEQHDSAMIENNGRRAPGGILATIKSSQSLTGDLNEDEHCQICGDLASGWHCGAITCEACKKFFLRSMSTGDGKKKYKCQRELTCLITKRSRTQCQYCRFQKCLSVGMKPHESVGPKTEDLYRKLPCLVCGASASGIHFGAVTCEACKGFFRRSIKENAPERYHCSENNHCEIVSTSKITCRSCRFQKCLQVGMSMDASRIGRQSNLFKESIRQLQNGSTSMATINDSARIASMAKRRKTKTKTGRVFASTNEIDIELSPAIKQFIDQLHSAYVMHLKDLPRCVPRETVWSTMASQMLVYAQAVMNFCQKAIPGFMNMCEKYDVVSSSINSVIIVILLSEKTSVKSSLNNCQSTWNYWQAEARLAMELNAHILQLTEVENCYRSFQPKFKDLQLDEKELALLLFMIITRTNLNPLNEENKSWSKCQFECVQAFSQYTQVRRSSNNGEMPIEFYDIAFLVSQLRSLNRRLSQCLMNLPWPFIPNLPSFFYRIYLPSAESVPQPVNSSLYNL